MHDPAHWRARIGTKTQSVLGGNGAPVRSATSRHAPWPHGATDLQSLGNGTADKRTPWITWSARHLEKLALNKEKGGEKVGGTPACGALQGQQHCHESLNPSGIRFLFPRPHLCFERFR